MKFQSHNKHPACVSLGGNPCAVVISTSIIIIIVRDLEEFHGAGVYISNFYSLCVPQEERVSKEEAKIPLPHAPLYFIVHNAL